MNKYPEAALCLTQATARVGVAVLFGTVPPLPEGREAPQPQLPLPFQAVLAPLSDHGPVQMRCFHDNAVL